MKKIIKDLLIVGMSLALLWHFALIWRYGEYLMQQPNVVYLGLETAGLLAVFAFGVYWLVSDLRGARR